MTMGNQPEVTNLGQRLNALATLSQHMSPQALEASKPSLALNQDRQDRPSEGRKRKPEQTFNPQER